MKDIGEWKEIKSDKVRVFQLDEEPEIFYLIKIRDNEYMTIQEDGYDLNTGKVEFANKKEIEDKYSIDLYSFDI